MTRKTPVLLHHVQVSCPEGGEDAARRFYGEVLGLPEVAKPAALAKRGGCWFRDEGVEVHVGVEPDFRPARKAHPAFLLAEPHVDGTDEALALLLGVNVGPTVLVTGSLAGLLWLESARRCGLDVGAREYARVGLVAGVPALLAAIAVLAATT